MKSLLFLVAFISITTYAQKGRLIPNPVRNIPRWVRNEFSVQQLDRQYEITYQLYPPFLKGDFNGDGKSDIAVLIAEKSSGKLGIALVHGKQAQAFKHRITILGAGKQLGTVGDDFKWMNLWSTLSGKKSLAENDQRLFPALHGTGIRLQQRDDGAGLIYWDGKKYEWRRLGK